MKVFLFLMFMTPFLVTAQDETPSLVEEKYKEDDVPEKGIEPVPQLQEEKKDNSIDNPFNVGPYEAGKYQYVPQEEDQP